MRDIRATSGDAARSAGVADVTYASINVKPEWGGGGGGGWARAYVGHLTSIAFPTPGNLTKNLVPGWGRLPFFCTEEWEQVTSSHMLVCAPMLISVS